jgi:hypothetical protein
MAVPKYNPYHAIETFQRKDSESVLRLAMGQAGSR